MDTDEWVHLNCALWSYEVYETMNGALVNVDQAVRRGAGVDCVLCQRPGATIACFKKPRCTNVYHVSCAQRDGACFFQDKVCEGGLLLLRPGQGLWGEVFVASFRTRSVGGEAFVASPRTRSVRGGFCCFAQDKVCRGSFVASPRSFVASPRTRSVGGSFVASPRTKSVEGLLLLCP